MKEQDSKSPVLRVLFYLLVLVILVFNLFPFFYAVVSSFRPSSDLFSTDLIPKAFTLIHYDEIFKDARFVAGLINSIVICRLYRIDRVGARQPLCLRPREVAIPLQGVCSLPRADHDDVSADFRAFGPFCYAQGAGPV